MSKLKDSASHLGFIPHSAPHSPPQLIHIDMPLPLLSSLSLAMLRTATSFNCRWSRVSGEYLKSAQDSPTDGEKREHEKAHLSHQNHYWTRCLILWISQSCQDLVTLTRIADLRISISTHVRHLKLLKTKIWINRLTSLKLTSRDFIGLHRLCGMRRPCQAL